MQPLPLFPLPAVLVPGLVMPLHVFEPRYRALVEHLLDKPPERRVFGVVALRPGRDVREGVSALHAVGVTAVVREITPTDDGRYDVVTSGAVRFRLHGLDATAGAPYATGLVEPLEDPEGDPARAAGLAVRVAAAFASYRSTLGGSDDPVGVSSPRVLSHLVTAGAVLPLHERQALLEMPDAVTRLTAELRLLAREEALVAATGALPQMTPDLSFLTPW